MRRIFLTLTSILYLLAFGWAASCSADGPVPSFFGEPFGDKKEVLVLDATFNEGMDLALIALADKYQGAVFVRTLDGARAAVYNLSGIMGKEDAATIEPMVVVNLEKADDYGVIYRVGVATKDGGVSPDEGKFRGAFSEILENTRKERGAGIKTFRKYEVTQDKGVAERVPASVPVAYEGFKKYIDAQGGDDNYQGIWAFSDGRAVIGLIKVDGDPEYKYIGFVLESGLPNWKPGEVMIKTKELYIGQSTTGVCLLPNKFETGAVLVVGKDHMYATNLPDQDIPYVLVKQYPLPEEPKPCGENK